MAKTGRPPIEIDWAQFERLCGLQCTEEEIADWFKCSVDTIGRAVKKKYKISFAEFFRQKRGKGRISLRREQMRIALAGNVTMLIWLGKQYLGQVDKQEMSHRSIEPIQLNYSLKPKKKSEEPK